MKLTKSILLFIGLFTSSVSVMAETTIQPKIVGGTTATVNEYPWAVLLSWDSTTDQFFCGGTLIDDRWVLTAAHCVAGSLDADIFAFVGEYSKTNSNVTANQVDKIIVHPAYDDITSDNDIALLRLSVPETTITPVEIITPAVASVLEGRKSDYVDDVTVIGWGGLLAYSGLNPDFKNTYPATLQEVNLPYIDTSICNAPEALNGQVNANMMCAGVPEGGVDSCQGDSGGPLLFYDSNIWYQAGIVSWGYGCAQPNKYGVYTRVENYINWIRQSMTITPIIDFSTWVNGKTIVRQIEIDNATKSSFNISGVTSSNNAVFAIGNNTCGSTVAIGDTCSIDVSFIASLVGSYSGYITIDTDQFGPVTVDLTAKIASPVMINFVDVGGLDIVFGGNANWVESYATTNGYVLQSGNIGNSQRSSVFTYVNIPPGGNGKRSLFFDWKACSEQNFDYLQLWVDNVKKDALTGNADWSRKELVIEGDGDHIVEWRYAKDYACSAGTDAGWIDNLSLDTASVNSTPVHSSGCNINDIHPLQLPCANPPSSSGGGSLSGWFYPGLAIPFLLRRRIKK